MYKLIRSFLFRMDPEDAHDRVARLGSLVKRYESLIQRFYHFESSSLEQTLFNPPYQPVKFKNPLGIAAGFDKDAKLVNILHCFGPSFSMVGTVTYNEQLGNDKKRIFRIPENKAICNRMGFPSEGLQYVLGFLERCDHKLLVGVNIGKQKDAFYDQNIRDHVEMVKTLKEYADFIEVNVSSPNTEGLRDWQARGPLRDLLCAIQTVNFPDPKPLILKIDGDMDLRSLDDVIDVATETKLAGIAAINTTKTRPTLSPNRIVEVGNGGLSGYPLKHLALSRIRHIYEAAGDKLTIFGMGGTFTANDVWDKMLAGASLTPIFTGMIYEGAGQFKKIKKGLVKKLKQYNLDNISQIIGKEKNYK